MNEIVCQVSNRENQVEFIWSAGGGFFRPYAVAGAQLGELREATRTVRKALGEMVYALNFAGDGAAALGTGLRAGRGGLPPLQLPAAERGRDRQEGPTMARGAAEAVAAGRAGDRRRGAVGRPARLPLRALEPGLRRAAGQAQAGLPVREGRRALAAVLVDPLQPDQRPPGRAPEADADLERAARHRRGGPGGLWPSRGRAEGGSWTPSWPRRA